MQSLIYLKEKNAKNNKKDNSLVFKHSQEELKRMVLKNGSAKPN